MDRCKKSECWNATHQRTCFYLRHFCSWLSLGNFRGPDTGKDNVRGFFVALVAFVLGIVTPPPDNRSLRNQFSEFFQHSSKGFRDTQILGKLKVVVKELRYRNGSLAQTTVLGTLSELEPGCFTGCLYECFVKGVTWDPYTQPTPFHAHTGGWGHTLA